VDVGIAWARQALDAMRRTAERVYQTTGGVVSAPAAAASPSSRPLPSDLPSRATTATRPLADISQPVPGISLFARESAPTAAAEAPAPELPPTTAADGPAPAK
jgi:hypothetical protein